MAQLGRYDETFSDPGSGRPRSGAAVQIYREGATVSSNQSGTTPLTVTVRHRGKIVAGDTVFVNLTPSTTYTVNSVTATTVVLSGFAGTLSLTNGDRLIPSNNLPTLYSDDFGGATTANPLMTSSVGRVNCWLEFGAYEGVVSIGGAAVLNLTSQVVSTENPGQLRYVDDYAGGSSTGGIQEAINDLPAIGGTIVLSGGATYIPTVVTTLVNSLTIEGNGATIQRSASLDALSVFKDSGSALSKITLRDIIFDNNSRAATKEDILLTGGATDIICEDCRWINLTNRTEDLTRIATSATKGARIAWRNNTVIGPGAQQNFNSFQIFDCDNVDVSGNVIDGWGAIKLEGSLAANLYNWNVSHNRMKGVAQSNIFCRIQSASSIWSISVNNNTITDSGKTAVAIGAINAGDTGTINGVSITGNVVRGFALNLADSAIALGGNITSGTYYMTNVVVSGNSIDGQDSTGAQPADQNRGIQFSSGIQHFSCTGNVVRHCGRDGIATLGVTDGSITGNTVERCAVQDTSASAPTPAQQGGITIYTQGTYATKKVSIIGNISKNNGVSGALKSYGINLGPNTGALKATLLHVANNICYDDQGTPTQDYGIIIGSSGNQGPDDSLIQNNDLRGNATGGILGPLGTATGVFLRDNVPNDGITRNITAVGDAITPSASRVLLTANGNYTLTSAPTVLNGYWNGQEIEIMNIDTADTITLQDQGSLASSNLRLSAASIALAPRDSIRLRYDTTIADWVQVGQVNVI